MKIKAVYENEDYEFVKRLNKLLHEMSKADDFISGVELYDEQKCVEALHRFMEMLKPEVANKLFVMLPAGGGGRPKIHVENYIRKAVEEMDEEDEDEDCLKNAINEMTDEED